MPANLRPFTQNEMLLVWADSEIEEARFNIWPQVRYYRERLRLRPNEPYTDFEKNELISALVTNPDRRGLVKWVLANPTEWHVADFTLDELSQVRADYYWLVNFRAKTVRDISLLPSRIGKQDFERNRMRGRPVVVGPNRSGDLMLIDGAHRCSEILRMQPPGRPLSIEVIVGVCPTITSWPRFAPR
jgi:hypothetical protein